MDPIINVKNISKTYTIRHERGGYVTLRDILTDTFMHPLKFLKKKIKRITGREKDEIFWALRDINFSVKKGETLGIIGANGAGKSTLLKILSQITPPSHGEVIVRGKMTSLLEVGTGFHPELTGKENISLNGAIMGMTSKEVERKFDQIVEFAGIDKFLDTPVKYYSSGMYVRLAFSVAAHMEPDILVIDEVLAVGDAEFQKKCLGKMEEVTRDANRTILFVSHNMQAVERLCSRCILLRSGKIIKIGPTKEVIDYYLHKEQNMSAVLEYDTPGVTGVRITKISILGKNNKPTTQIPVNDSFSVKVEYEFLKELENLTLSLMFSVEGEILLNSSSADKDAKTKTYTPGKYTSVITVPASLFNVGSYYMRVCFLRPSQRQIFDPKVDIPFEITDVNNPRAEIYRNWIPGKLATLLEYKTEKSR